MLNLGDLNRRVYMYTISHTLILLPRLPMSRSRGTLSYGLLKVLQR